MSGRRLLSRLEQLAVLLRHRVRGLEYLALLDQVLDVFHRGSTEPPVVGSSLRHLDEGADYVEIDQVRLETDIPPQQLRAGLRALATADPPYIDFREASGWKDDYAAGEINSVSERARRELGSWPSPESLVSALAAALAQAAEREEEPERKRRLTAAADAIGSFARDVAVGVFTQKLGQYVP